MVVAGEGVERLGRLGLRLAIVLPSVAILVHTPGLVSGTAMIPRTNTPTSLRLAVFSLRSHVTGMSEGDTMLGDAFLNLGRVDKRPPGGLGVVCLQQADRSR
jgi:hypothetical protein